MNDGKSQEKEGLFVVEVLFFDTVFAHRGFSSHRSIFEPLDL